MQDEKFGKSLQYVCICQNATLLSQNLFNNLYCREWGGLMESSAPNSLWQTLSSARYARQDRAEIQE